LQIVPIHIQAKSQSPVPAIPMMYLPHNHTSFCCNSFNFAQAYYWLSGLLSPNKILAGDEAHPSSDDQRQLMPKLAALLFVLFS
jgi:hypothetical protein